MEQLIQQLLNGIVMGGFYVLVALGLTLIFGILGIPHFAHGAVAIAGGYLSYLIVTKLHFSLFPAMVVCMVVTAALGAAIERIAYRPVSHAPPINAFIIALGLLMFMETSMTLIFGPDQIMIPSSYHKVLSLGGVSLVSLRLYLLLTSIVLIVLLYVFIKYTKLGKAIRAVSQNPDASRVVGININRIRLLVFALGSALAAAAGTFIGSLFALYPSMGGNIVMKGFVVIILGGLGSFPGAIIGGMLIGITESLGGWLISSAYKDVFSFAIMILLLVFRPQGLLGKR